MTTTLLIARHGNTFGPDDVVTRVGGRTDLPLVESGLVQGVRLGLYLKEHDLVPDVIFTSALARAKQTAAKAQEAMGTSLVPRVLEIFNEIDYGPDENQPETEVVARLGADTLKAWDENGIVPDGWQVDPAQMELAWVDFGQHVAAQFSGQRILVVSSNGVIRFAPSLTGDVAAFKENYRPKVATGSLSHFEYVGPYWNCLAWNVKPA